MDEKQTIIVGDYSYDITDFKHPGGNVIKYMVGQDATNVFEEFHFRSKKAKHILHSLPRTKIVLTKTEKDDTNEKNHTKDDDTKTTEQKMLVDFARFRQSLVDRGFFNPSYSHITYRIVELFIIYSFAVYAMRYNMAISIILLGLFSGRCGWVQHEGGHNSFTGNIKTDKMIQNIFMGFGLLADGTMWNSMHNKHHATTQKIGYDMDLDTAPFVLFYPGDLDIQKQISNRFDATKEDDANSGVLTLSYEDKSSSDNPRTPTFSASRMPNSGVLADPTPTQEQSKQFHILDKVAKVWLKYQVYTFLPITSGIFVSLFWLLYLHPRKIIRDRNATQALIVSVGHVSRLALFMKMGNATIYQALWYHFLSVWVAGLYLFGHFSLSHTFMPVVETNDNPNWVRYSLEHTVDIEPQNYAVSWIMGHLNNQVVHHLFPSMPQYRGPEVSKELVVFCKKWDLQYNIITYREAWSSMFSNLRKVGDEVYSRI
jgi:fatty acid desaturase